MKLILFLDFDEVISHRFPEAYINERLRDEQFDLDKMILSGATLDGDRLWYAQERFGHGRSM